MISVEQGPKTRPDGGSTSFNALAFSTLLSSQETDAHLRVSLRFPVGATLKHYLRVSFMSSSFPEVIREVADSRSLRPRVSGLRKLRACGISRSRSLGAPRVPSRLVSQLRP